MTEQLRAGGWVEGQNIALEYRLDEGKRERLPTLAAELVDLKVSAIVAIGTPAALAAKRATATIPIVMINVGDPVRSGLATSLPRPGGNVTGMAFMGPEITFKQVELLKEVLPPAGAIGLLYDPLNPAQVDSLADVVSTAAAAARLKVHPIEVAASSPLDAAFVEVTRKRIDGLLVYPLDRPPGWARDVAALATKRRLPTVGSFRWFAEQGMLMAFAARAEEQYQRAGVYIDRLLRGARASALPIEQPTRFHLVVNAKTAKALGLTIPPSVLARADEVIQ
jgi:putative ABC transport system substrate-binding protein